MLFNIINNNGKLSLCFFKFFVLNIDLLSGFSNTFFKDSLVFLQTFSLIGYIAVNDSTNNKKKQYPEPPGTPPGWTNLYYQVNTLIVPHSVVVSCLYSESIGSRIQVCICCLTVGCVVPIVLEIFKIIGILVTGGLCIVKCCKVNGNHIVFVGNRDPVC